MADNQSMSLTERDILTLREVIVQNPSLQVDNHTLAKNAGYPSPDAARAGWYRLRKWFSADGGQDAASPSGVKKRKTGAKDDTAEAAGEGDGGSSKRAKRSGKTRKADDGSQAKAGKGGCSGEEAAGSGLKQESDQ